jgi:hypothetical protein
MNVMTSDHRVFVTINLPLGKAYSKYSRLKLTVGKERDQMAVKMDYELKNVVSFNFVESGIMRRKKTKLIRDL